MAKHSSKIPDKVQRQRDEADRIEREQLARQAAEKMLTPEQRAEQNTPEPQRQPTEERTLEQRLADIERRAKERAAEEKAALAQHYLIESRNKFKRAVSNTTDEDVKKAYEEMTRLEKLVDDTPRTALEGKLFDNGNGEKTTRVRRSAEDLSADAAKLVDYLKEHPNSKGSAAVEATGAVVKQPLNVKTFIEKYYAGGKIKVKTEGQKAGTTYSIG